MSPLIMTSLLLALGLGTTITFSSSHWLLAWVGLEINTLAIIPLMAQMHHPRSVEAATKYFLIQATAAAVILFASTTQAWLSGEWNILQTMHPLPHTVLSLALLLKLGLAPLHAWLPEILQGLDLTTGLILSTWQKLAPLTLLLQLQTNPTPLLMICGLLSIVVGGWGGLNQTQLRKILAYSSIAHLGWIVLVIQFSPSIAWLSLLLYITMTSSIFLSLKFLNAKTTSSLTLAWTKAPLITTLMPLALLSLGGLPPLSGFLPKWLILQELTKQMLPLLATIAALSALLSLYYYVRLSYNSTLTLAPNHTTAHTLWHLSPHPSGLSLPLSLTLSLLLLPLLPALVSLTL